MEFYACLKIVYNSNIMWLKMYVKNDQGIKMPNQ